MRSISIQEKYSQKVTFYLILILVIADVIISRYLTMLLGMMGLFAALTTPFLMKKYGNKYMMVYGGYVLTIILFVMTYLSL
jgi:hypothetical protein